MLKRFGCLGILLFANLASCMAQLCLTTHQADLYCVLPNAFQITSQPGLNLFGKTLAPVVITLSELPTAKPSGIRLEYAGGVLRPVDETFGPVFSEKAETIGRKRVFFETTYQFFGFSSVDGMDVKHIPVVIGYPTPLNANQHASVTNDRFSFKASQYTILAAFGITDRMDLSVALPIERISISAAVSGQFYSFSPPAPTTSISQNARGRAIGVGDLVVGGKANLVDRGRFGIGAGLDLRFPTGDELNFLGAGAIGVKPYLVVSRHGLLSPHVNIGVQANGGSVLNPDANGNKQHLPTDFFYTLGAGAGNSAHATVIADLVVHHLFDAPRLAPPAQSPNVTAIPALTVIPYTGSYTTVDLSLGAKWKLVSNLVLTTNGLIKLNNAGARSRFVPLGALSYSF